MYDDDHPALLASAIDAHLCHDPDARVLVMVPQRDGTTKGLLMSLMGEMARQSAPLICVEENLVPGQDDWGNGDDDERRHVGFWWGVFR